MQWALICFDDPGRGLWRICSTASAVAALPSLYSSPYSFPWRPALIYPPLWLLIHTAHIYGLSLPSLPSGVGREQERRAKLEPKLNMSYILELHPSFGVSHQPDSSTFRLERGRELMTRRADTDMTCSRGKAGTVGYATMACCFLQDLFLNAIIRSAISPYRNSLTFDAWPGSEWQSRNLRLTPGRPPNVVRPLGRERSLQPSSSLRFVRRCAGLPCCTLARRGWRPC